MTDSTAGTPAPKDDRCPICKGPVDITPAGDDGAGGSTRLIISHKLLVGEVALVLDNEAAARAVATLMPPQLRLAIAAVMLEPPQGGSPYFGPQDVEDEAEARARCLGVVRELRARERHVEAANFVALGERHGKRALRIINLLPEDEQIHLRKKIYGPELGGDSAVIEVVKS